MLETKESDVLESFQEGGLQEDGRISLETDNRMLLWGKRRYLGAKYSINTSDIRMYVCSQGIYA